MSGMILCRSEYSKRPYYIAGIAIDVYSIEEICYFLYNDIYLVGMDFFSEEFFAFLEKDIKEPELAKHLRFLKDENAGLSEMVLTVLRYVDYYTEAEIDQLSNLIDKLDSQNVFERLKARADNYLSTKRYVSAVRNYEDILWGKYDTQPREDFFGSVWHNMGTAYARMFRFREAASCFEQAYEINHNEETKRDYYTALHLCQKEDDTEDIIEDEEMYVAGKELETLKENAKQQEEYQPVREALKYKKEGRIGDYYSKLDQLVKEWQNQYKNYIR